ncbi:hypothetical protein FRC09_013766 [Ceratobasidium sp. 395]|nr:hypothetical protein FRC09_013766 [Ceratobasidium sp. 395]
MPMTTRSSSLSKNDAHDAVARPSTKTSSKRPNPASEASTDANSSLTRPLKRTRVHASAPKAPLKKRAGNENENMMTLPIEVFTQQLDTTRVPGLPTCPRWMPEPEYAALLFSKLCTLCGSSTTFKPDPYLFARLCASCRDTSLVDYDEAVEKWHIEDLVIWSKSLIGSVSAETLNGFCKDVRNPIRAL